MPFEGFALVTERIGAIEGQKLTISTATNRTFDLATQTIDSSPCRCLNSPKFFTPCWANDIFEERFQ